MSTSWEARVRRHTVVNLQRVRETWPMYDLDALPAISTVEQLEQYGVPAPATRDKVLPALEPLHEEFLACLAAGDDRDDGRRGWLRRLAQG